MSTGQTTGVARLGGTLALIGMIVALACAVAMAASGFGYRLDLWHFRTGFTIIRWSFWIGAGAAVVSLLGLILSRGKPPKMLAAALVGIAVGAVVAYIPWSWKQTLDAHPYIHDITTDIQNPPAYVAVKGLRKAGDHPVEYDGPEVAEQQRKAYPDLITLTVASDKNKVFAAAEAAVRTMKLEVVEANVDEGRIEATHTSLFYGFKDDVVVRVVADGNGSRVDVRSKSRVGRSDLGQNAKRIRTFMQTLQANLNQ
jgi:uncharacterized protein (DUF1499 family)